MKTIPLAIALSLTTTMSFICTYFFNLTIDNSSQYLGLISVVLLDGLFGIIAGIKREGFKTFKTSNKQKNINIYKKYPKVAVGFC